MTLALVQAVVASILVMVATWTGLLVSVALLLPQQTAKSEQMLTTSPWKCFLQGLAMVIVLLMGVGFVSVPLPAAKLLGLGFLMLVGAVMTVGAAGMVQIIGKRGEAQSTVPTFALLLRGSLVYSLAMGFPYVGWFVFAPLAVTFAMGAGLMALLPERKTSPTPPNLPPTPPDYDIANRQGAV